MKNLVISFFILLTPYVNSAQNWDSLNSGVNKELRCMYTDSMKGLLYVGGGFYEVDHQNIRGIAAWDGISWSDLNIGVDTSTSLGDPGRVFSITKYGDEIIAGGTFKSAGGVDSKFIARWDGTNWHPFNGQPNQVVNDMIVYANELYVCGDFDSLGTVEAHGVGKWNGNTWSSVGNLPHFSTNKINGIEFYNGLLFLLGSILDSSLAFSHHLGWYDGTDWHFFIDDLKGQLVSGFDLIVYQDELYVSGFFNQLDGNFGNNIQRWNGSSWHDVAGGTGGSNGTVHKMKVQNNQLYVVGAFEKASDIIAQKIAIWDSEKWCGLGSEFDNTINAIEFLKDTLIVGGGFMSVDGDSMYRISKWKGGNFIDTCSEPSGIADFVPASSIFLLYPNPACNEIVLLSSIKNAELIISDEIGHIKNSFFIDTQQMIVDLTSYSSGFYFITIKTVHGIIETKKFFKLD